jgi:hypothetical protein
VGQIATPLIGRDFRRELEKKSGRKVVSRENYLDAPESAKRLPPGWTEIMQSINRL